MGDAAMPRRTAATFPAAIILLALLPGSAAAQASAARPSPRAPETLRPALVASRVADAPPVIDGRLDDAIWQRAAVATDFVQRSPAPGAPATHRTEARVAYDHAAIYIAMRMYDPAPDSIAAQLARRDATGIHSDWADVLIDSYHDRRSAYRFSVNPAGVRKDVYHFDDGREDIGWDAVWDVATQIDELGWTAEFRIPLSQLRYAPAPPDGGELTWGIQFGRQIARHDETSFWAAVLPTTPGFVSLAGELRGLHGLDSPRRLELLPYAVSRVTRAPPRPDDPFYRATAPAASVGADVKYGITSNLTLTATANPDFGQVEADPSVVNLSAFESFFPERRPFFMEGANLFSMPIGDDSSGEDLFYSRRIGRTPQRRSFGEAQYAAVPDAVRIIAAAKLTGRTARGWSVGFLDAVTERTTARVALDGAITSAAAEPLTNYAVGRIGRDLRAGASSIGVVFTATHRQIDDPALEFLRAAAYVGGVDARHRFGGGNYQLSGYAAGSSIHGEPLAIQLAQRAPARYFHRPDAAHVSYDPARTALRGAAGRVYLSRIGGGRLTGTIGGAFRTPGFEVNDAGFQNNADQRFVFLSMNYKSFEAGRHLRRWNVGINPSTGWDFGGTRLWSQLNSWGSATTGGFWSINAFFNHSFDGTSVGALRGGPALYRPGSNRANLNVTSDRRRAVFFNAGVATSRDHDGEAGQANVFGSVTVRPSARLELMLNPGYTVHRHGWQYVASPAAHSADGSGTGRAEHIVGSLRQHTVALTTRATYTVSPTLSVQLYAQPFISAGAYDAFRRVASARALRFYERLSTLDATAVSRSGEQYRAELGDGDQVSFTDPAFNVKQLRSNALLRWEYRPGSTLFVVWSQARDGFIRDGSFSFGRDADDLFAMPATNVLLVKLSYWLDR
jgi:hypothetical protein